MSAPKPILDLKTATDNEINAAVAEYVAGWQWRHDLQLGSNTLQRPNPGGFLGALAHGKRAGLRNDTGSVPDYLNDANAVLPLLYRTHWEVNQTTVPSRPIRVRIYVIDGGGWGEADNLPRAACIALLRASGKVEITK